MITIPLLLAAVPTVVYYAVLIVLLLLCLLVLSITDTSNAGDDKVSKKHPGFKAVQNKIAKKEGVSKKDAGAILANASRHASKKAKKKNPKLKKVK